MRANDREHDDEQARLTPAGLPAVIVMQMASKPTMPCHYPQCKIIINGTEQCDEGRNCR
jgi:hypothetical protein